LVYSIHNETFVISPHQRLDQVRTVVKDADTRRLPVIVAGDFNTMEVFARAETARLFREAGYVHATRGSGRTAYPWHGPVGVVLDHVFVRGFDVVRFGTRPGSSSDHLPLFAELRWSAPAAHSPGAPVLTGQ
jgi:endonuclease/exonuclease/phosphatase (EEP) superfamily protein YafD